MNTPLGSFWVSFSLSQSCGAESPLLQYENSNDVGSMFKLLEHTRSRGQQRGARPKQDRDHTDVGEMVLEASLRSTNGVQSGAF